MKQWRKFKVRMMKMRSNSKGIKFESDEFAKMCYDAYAKRVGFVIGVGQCSNCVKPDEPAVSWDFGCCKEVYRRKNVDNCEAVIRIEKKDPGRWVVTKFVEEHNHILVPPNKVQISSRRQSVGLKNNGKTTAVAANRFVSMDGNPMSLELPRNVLSGEMVLMPMSTLSLGYGVPYSRRRTWKDTHNLLSYFRKMQAENPGLFYAIQLDEGNCVTNVLWADARSRAAYCHFGDAVTFETLYKFNQYQVPFAPFTWNQSSWSDGMRCSLMSLMHLLHGFSRLSCIQAVVSHK